MKNKKLTTDEMITFEKIKPLETRLLFVDGHNLLFQMFFGFPKKIKNKQGKVINGTLGFVSTLLKVIRSLSITHCLVVFDKEQKLKNKELLSDYKANRPDWSEVAEEDNPFSQLDDIEKALKHLNIHYIFSDFGLEADDYINTYIKQLESSFDKIFILSKDTDFYQVASNNIFLINYSGKNTKILSDASIYERLGVYPKHYAFFKALTGDSADNIKGIDGVGKVIAKKIIDKHGTIEELFQNLSTLPKKLSVNLVGNKERLILNKQLISFEVSRKIKTLSSSLLQVNNVENANGYQILKTLEIV